MIYKRIKNGLDQSRHWTKDQSRDLSRNQSRDKFWRISGLLNPCLDNEQGLFEFDVTKGGFEMTIDCWITEVAEEINDEEVNPDSKLYSKVRS